MICSVARTFFTITPMGGLEPFPRYFRHKFRLFATLPTCQHRTKSRVGGCEDPVDTILPTLHGF